MNCDHFCRVYTFRVCVISKVISLTYRSCGRCGPAIVQSAETADRENKGAPLPPTFYYHFIQSIMSQRQSMICELLFPSSILVVKMNRKTLVIVLETEIYIYDISNMRLQHVIETRPTPKRSSPSRAPPITHTLHIPPQCQFPRRFPLITDTTRAVTRSCSIGRRAALLYQVSHRLPNHPCAQGADLRARIEQHPHAPRDGLGEGHRHPCVGRP
jgi:hypothetical protein